MEIYIVIVRDRHSDTEVYPFTSSSRAIAEAKRVAKEYCSHPEDYQEHDYGADAGWLFYADYSCESDHVRVVTARMDRDIQVGL